MTKPNFVFLLSEQTQGSTFAAIHCNQNQAVIRELIRQAIKDQLVADKVNLSVFSLRPIPEHGITFPVDVFTDGGSMIYTFKITRVILY